MENIFEQNHICLKRFQYVFFVLGILYSIFVLFMAVSIFSGAAKGGTNTILTMVTLPSFLGYVFPIFFNIGASQAIGWIIGEKSEPTWLLRNGHWIMYMYGVFIFYNHALLSVYASALYSISLLNSCSLASGLFLGGYLLKRWIKYQSK